MNLGKLVFAQLTQHRPLTTFRRCVARYGGEHFDTPLHRIKFRAPKTGKRLAFLTNNFGLPAITIAELYRWRWQVELFFKWIKQHLRTKVFFGTSENAVNTQIRITVSVYVLVALGKKSGSTSRRASMKCYRS